MSTIIDSPYLLRGIELWGKLVGVDPMKDTANGQAMTLGEWQYAETFKDLAESIKLDPSGITCMLLLRYFMREHLAQTQVSVLDMLDDPQRIEQHMRTVRELNDHLEQSASVREAFREVLTRAAAHYEADQREDVQAMLADPGWLAVLRMAALRSMDRIRVDQFLDGQIEDDGMRPTYGRTVHQWWNINSLLQWASHMPSGISLNLVRDPDIFESYFCFAVRNGARLFVVSDVPEHAHPLASRMMRRPDRHLNRRAMQNWFPYDLLDLEYDEESGRLYQTVSRQRALVAHQGASLPIKDFKDLAPAELLWTVMMFDLIQERFWRQKWAAPTLSYTAEMIQVQDALSARCEHLPVVAYRPLELPTLSVDDVRRDTRDDSEDDQSEFGTRYSRSNDWMEARYAHAVRDDSLALLCMPSDRPSLSASGEIVPAEAKPSAQVVSRRRRNRSEVLQLEGLVPTTFGSPAKLQADRKFLARHNFAVQIDRLARDEYERRREDVTQEFRRRVHENLSALLGLARYKELWVEDGVHSSFSRHVGHSGPSMSVEVEGYSMHAPRKVCHGMLRRLDYQEARRDPYSGLFGVHMIGGVNFSHQALCAIDGTKASTVHVLYPHNPRELAFLAGCREDELDEVLQHFDLMRPYDGNSILDRVDPMHWACENPWLNLDLRVGLALSKRGLAKAMKMSATLPPWISSAIEWRAQDDAEDAGRSRLSI